MAHSHFRFCSVESLFLLLVFFLSLPLRLTPRQLPICVSRSLLPTLSCFLPRYSFNSVGMSFGFVPFHSKLNDQKVFEPSLQPAASAMPQALSVHVHVHVYREFMIDISIVARRALATLTPVSSSSLRAAPSDSPSPNLDARRACATLPCTAPVIISIGCLSCTYAGAADFRFQSWNLWTISSCAHRLRPPSAA